MSYLAPGLLLILVLAGCGAEGRADADVGPAARASIPRFSDVTSEAGLGGFRHENGARGKRLFPETMSGAVAFIDSNDDGWQDLLLVGGGALVGRSDVPAVRLFENEGDGSFVEVTSERGLARIHGYGMGFAVADYDNDGDDDFLLTTVYQDLLFRNDRETGRFTEVGTTAGVSGDSAWSTSAMFFDADADGWLDLFIGRYVVWTPETDLWCMAKGTKSYCTPEVYRGMPSRFYHNAGDGTFADWTDRAGLTLSGGKTLGVAALDFNDDGWIDVAVANDTEPDALFRNDGDGTFTEIGAASGVAYDDRGRARAGMGIDAGILDTSGAPTIVVGNFANEMIGVYQYRGNGTFRDRAAVSRIGSASRRTLAFGLFLFDVDLDADLDLFVANGHITPEVDAVDDDITFRQAPHLFLNDGAGQFDDVAGRAGQPLAEPMLGRGAAYADYDRDGDLDVVVVENGGPVRLLRNEVRSSHSGPSYLRIEWQAGASRGPVIGTRVTAWNDGAGQARLVRSGSSYQSQSELPVTFGCAGANEIDSVVVRWPRGNRTVMAPARCNQIIRVPGASAPLAAFLDESAENEVR